MAATTAVVVAAALAEEEESLLLLWMVIDVALIGFVSWWRFSVAVDDGGCSLLSSGGRRQSRCLIAWMWP